MVHASHANHLGINGSRASASSLLLTRVDHQRFSSPPELHACFVYAEMEGNTRGPRA